MNIELVNYLETQKEQREMFLACANETKEKIAELKEQIKSLEESIKDVDFVGLENEINKIKGFIDSLTQPVVDNQEEINQEVVDENLVEE